MGFARGSHGSLVAQNGYAIASQKRRSGAFPGHPDLPSRIIVVDANGSVTFDVLTWLSNQAILLIQVNRVARRWLSPGYGYVRRSEALVQAQKAAHANEGARRCDFAGSW